MSSYLDGAVTRRQLAQMNEHLRDCVECAGRFASVQRTQSLVGSLGRKVAPPDLTLKLRVAHLAGDRQLASLALGEAAGALGKCLQCDHGSGHRRPGDHAGHFWLLISFLYPAQVRASNDVPTMLYTPAELQSTPFELSMGAANADSLVVEAYVGADGRVQDYRILSAPEDAEAILAATEEHADLHHLPSRDRLRPAYRQPGGPDVL